MITGFLESYWGLMVPHQGFLKPHYLGLLVPYKRLLESYLRLLFPHDVLIELYLRFLVAYGGGDSRDLFLTSDNTLGVA